MKLVAVADQDKLRTFSAAGQTSGIWGPASRWGMDNPQGGVVGEDRAWQVRDEAAMRC